MNPMNAATIFVFEDVIYVYLVMIIESTLHCY